MYVELVEWDYALGEWRGTGTLTFAWKSLGHARCSCCERTLSFGSYYTLHTYGRLRYAACGRCQAFRLPLPPVEDRETELELPAVYVTRVRHTEPIALRKIALRRY